MKAEAIKIKCNVNSIITKTVVSSHLFNLFNLNYTKITLNFNHILPSKEGKFKNVNIILIVNKELYKYFTFQSIKVNHMVLFYYMIPCIMLTL